MIFLILIFMQQMPHVFLIFLIKAYPLRYLFDHYMHFQLIAMHFSLQYSIIDVSVSDPFFHR